MWGPRAFSRGITASITRMLLSTKECSTAAAVAATRADTCGLKSLCQGSRFSKVATFVQPCSGVIARYQSTGLFRTLVNETKSTAKRSAMVAPSRTMFRSVSTSAQPSVSGLGSLVSGLSNGQRKAVTWWLGASSAWVFSMVVLGGVTRLTRSGLSMTDWKFTGEKPPQSEEEWHAEFERYKLSPEYKRVNKSMTLEEFKFIYWMEWAHRMWGRGLGIAFIIPFTAFLMNGAITKPLAARLGLLFTMGGTQAFVGWWMVRSGLQEPDSPHQIPRVSPYRLASHLTSAFAIYALMVWTTLSSAFPSPLSATTNGSGVAAMSQLRAKSLPFAVLLSVTALSGAFVAGLDAGHAYNTFPLMNGRWVPEEYWDVQGWRNAFENTAAVQFHHRCLAISTLVGSAALWKYGIGLKDLPRTPRLLLHGLALGTAIQVTLGISTLLMYVPVSLGAAHQAGALSLFTISLALIHSLRSHTLTPFQIALSKYGTPAAAAVVVGLGGAAAVSA